MKTRLASILLLLGMCLGNLSCIVDINADDHGHSDGSGTNGPTVGNATDAFGFALNARRLSMDEGYALDFTGDDLTIAVAVAAYQGGDGGFDLIGRGGRVLYHRDLDGNVADGNVVVRGQRPERARIWLDHFTGTIAIGVSRDR